MEASSNLKKFQTRNPVVRRLIDRFYADVGSMAAEHRPESVLDAGCGEGETLVRLAGILPEDVHGIDISAEAVSLARERAPGADVTTASLLELPYEDDRFDLVLCLEVLEHLHQPGAAVAELARVARGTVLISVPHEPWFRIGSLLRGNYVANLGNHPEHVNQFRQNNLRELLEPRLEVVEVRRAFPWLIAHCRTR